MKTLRRSLVVVALLASFAGLQSTSHAANAVKASPISRSATGCCYVIIGGKPMCVPC